VKEYVPGRRREIYVRDGQGNVLAVYEAVGESLLTKEFYIWSVQRLGYLMERRYLGQRYSRPPCLIGPPVPVQRVLGLPPGIGRPSVVADSVVELVRGSRRYELSDWLGNVRVVVTDVRVPVRQGRQLRGYRAEVVSVGDYYSFGAEIRARSYEIASVYSYGYQAQERDDEIYGRGASYYYKYRQQDARLGRFWSVDPLAGKYPYYSPYSFSGNRLVDAVEWEGLEPDRLPMYEGEIVIAPLGTNGPYKLWMGSAEDLGEGGLGPGRRWSPIVAYVETKADVSEEARRYYGRLEAIDGFGNALVEVGMGAVALPFTIEAAIAGAWLAPIMGAVLDLGAQLILKRGKEIDWNSVIVSGLVSGVGEFAFGGLVKPPTLTGFGWRGVQESVSSVISQQLVEGTVDPKKVAVDVGAGVSVKGMLHGAERLTRGKKLGQIIEAGKDVIDPASSRALSEIISQSILGNEKSNNEEK